MSANTWDVSGGGNYGFNSIWVNRNNSIFDSLDYKPQNEIKNLSENFKDAIIGLSDHTETIYPCIGAISMGASIVEKHYVHTKKIKGPDISSSMDNNELTELLKASKIIHRHHLICI